MAHSFITYKKNSEMFRDSDILLLIGLMRSSVTSQDSDDLRNLLEKWFAEYDNFLSGAIDLELDEHLQSPTLHKELMTCLRITSEKVLSKGEVVPGTWLTKILDDGAGAIYKDRNTNEILDKINRLETIIV